MRSLAIQRHAAGKTTRSALLLLTFIFFSHLVAAIVIARISGPSVFFKDDTAHYVETAGSLLHGSFSIDGYPEFFRTPGYPLLLVPAVVSGHVATVALLENFLLATAAGWLVWLIAEQLFPGSNVAWWAVLLYGLEPVGFLYSTTIMSETAFTAPLLLFIWLFLRFLDSPGYARLALSAAALAVATYVRPASLYLAFFLIVVLLVFPRRLPWQGRLARAIVFPLIVQLLLLPWVVRNAVIADYPGFSSAGDWNLYFLSAAAIQAKLDHRSFAETSAAMGANNYDVYFQQHPEQLTWTRGHIARFWGLEARKTIAGHWSMYLPIHARGMLTMILDPSASEILKLFRLYPEKGGLLARIQDEGPVRTALWLFRHYPVTMVVLPLLAVQLAFYYALAAMGLRRMPPAARATLAVILLYFVLVSGTPAAVARYRAPVMPLVCVCAGAALAMYWEKKVGAGEHTRKRPTFKTP